MAFFPRCFWIAAGLRWMASLALALAGAAPAAALVVATAHDAVTLLPPANDPGWSNVGRVGGGSAVYLGNRWVITSNHVSRGPLRLTDGRTFDVSIGSDVRLQNPGQAALFGQPDLRIFRLAEDPGLPALSIATATPPIGAQVTMIGGGLSKAPELVGWQLSSSAEGLQWNQVPLPHANTFGHALQTGSPQMRWGLNNLSDGPRFDDAQQTFVYNTTFEGPGSSFQAQGVMGDSGGGVFHQSGGDWQLSGIITAQSLFDNHPANTVVYGQGTVIADLSFYHDQILAWVERPEPLWQNQVNHFDVSGSGSVSPRDALLIINDLLRFGARDLDGSPGASDWYLDTNGDGSVSTADAMRVINHLLGSGGLSPTAAPQGNISLIPEPSTAVLAICGALVLLLARRIARRRVLL